MPRPLRPIDDRLVYHVINRGNNRAPVFFDDQDYAAFLKAVADLRQRRPFEFYGYCLMPNHVHLLIRPLETPISRIMQSLLVSHTQRYHRCHHGGGHVWQGRFKSPVIQDDDHLLTVLRYIEANPLRAGMVEAAGDYRWSSFPAHGLGAATRSSTRSPSTSHSPRPRPTAGAAGRPSSTRRPSDEELSALRRSTQVGLPYGHPDWVGGLLVSVLFSAKKALTPIIFSK